MTATRVAVRVEREGRRSPSRPRARPELPSASPAERVALPHRDRLEERFGRSLAGIAVYSGPRVAAALDRNGACAAVHDGRIFLADRVPALPVVAHEVAHVLQPRRPGSGVDVEPVGSAAEREAADLASAAGRPVGGAATPARGLDPDTLALLRRSRPGSDDGGEAVVLTIPERPDTIQAAAAGRERSGAGAADGGAAVTGSATRNVASPPVGEVPDTGPVTDVASSTRAVEAGAAGARSAAPAEIGPVTDDTVPVAVPTGPAAAPPAPELPAATTSAGLLAAFSSASPTTKAAWASTVGPELDRMATAEMEAVTADVPDLHARLGGAPVPDGPDTVVAPPARTVDVAPQAAAAPDPDIRAPEPLGEFRQAEDVAAPFALLSTAEPAAVADQIGESLAAVATVDPAVPRTAGPPPAVPTAGETDPALLEAAGHAAGAQAATAADEAAQAVLDGPGPERVQPVALDEAYPLGELPVPALGTTVPAEPATDSAGEGAAAGPQAYLAMGLPPEVQSAFDAQQHAAMQSSVSEAVTGSEQAAAARDEAKQQAVDQAESGLVQLNESSDADQRAAVTDARTRIQDARQDTLDRQRSEVDRVAGEAERRRVDDDERIRTRVAEDQRSIDASYTDAEKEVADEVAAGERRAAAEKAAAEKAAADDSWWDRAVDFVADAFDALVGAIGAIFDAVRSAVNAVLDAVAAAARAVIDAAAAFVKEAIAAFAAVLKAAVEGLIGQVFPELAAALTKAIDDAAAAATRAVDAVAEKLKAGVSALVEGLRAGLNAVIDGFRSAMTFAVGVLGAALTGDWAAVARKVLEAVLVLVGIAPEAFYAFVGRAEETWQIIVDDPGAFLGHAVDAVTGGVQRFAENIGTHLQAGVIGWLTGALGGAGIVLPPAFDLMGVLDIARQVLGLTWDTLRTRAAKLIGEKNVERLQVALDFIQTLVTEGWSGLWARITDSVATVRDNVFEAIRSFLFERVIVAAVTKLATMFNPVGAVVQLVLTLWNLYTFLRDQLSRIGEVVATVVDAIGDIARGKIDGAVTAVEGVLGRLLPLAIDLLARVLGLGNVADKVREILEGIRASVDKGIDGVLQRVAAAFGGGRASSADTAGQPAGTDDTTVAETFTLAGEKHTLRAVGSGDDLEPEMASGPFAGLIKRMNALSKQLTATYLDAKAETYVGATAAPVLTEKLASLRTKAQDLVNDLAKAKAPAGADAAARRKANKAERKIVLDGFAALRAAVADINLPEATAEAVHPGHGPKAGGERDYGRMTWFEVDPLSVDSLGKGESARGPVSGIAVLPEYDRGHLVARSLGGPGDASNLVPMSRAANTTSKGMQAGEDSLRWILGQMESRPRDYGPPDNRPYIFAYRVEAHYDGHGPTELENDLTDRRLERHYPGIDVVGAGVRLFKLAQGATAPPGPSNGKLLDALDPKLAPALGSNPELARNVRGRLAFYFHARTITQTVTVKQRPILWVLPPIKTLFPVDPNEGRERDVEWRR